MTDAQDDNRQAGGAGGRDQKAATRERRPRRRRATEHQHSELGEKLIAGVPARIMRPRLVFIALLVAILGFGLLMVYSASAVEALQEQGSSTYFLFRQGAIMVAGLILMLIIALAPSLSLDAYMGGLTKIMWIGIVVLLIAVFVMGAAAGGAVRWISLGFFNLQPSELAKPVIILAAARIMTEFYEQRAYDQNTFLLNLALITLLPLAFILLQPDFGTTVIILATVFAMLVFAGLSLKVVLGAFILGGLALLVMVIIAPYRMARIQAALDPWSDPYGNGYQATLAIMAFASGGLFGRGIGNSTMKYNYLPEAHNDYILAIIGEELGFVGTVTFFVVFCSMLYAGLLIAERCPRLQGKLIAFGCTFILAIQFFINALGILGAMPMTGKTMPFISYGGSSLIASLALAGLIIRVSIESNTKTVYDARREDFAVMDAYGYADTSSHMGRSTAGEARVRSARSGSSRSGFSVYDGGSAPRDSGHQGRPTPRPRSNVHRSAPSGGYERVNLNDNPSERLRSRGSRPRVDYDGPSRPRGGGRRGGAGPRTKGRGRYDR